jgi:cryptochrome
MKTDKTGQLVRKYCPELKDFPDKVWNPSSPSSPLPTYADITSPYQYIYSPHLAPLSVQKTANCIIGEDYPLPMLDEQIEKQRCIARIKNAYSLNLHGDSPEVMDGSAKELLKARHIESGALEVGEKKSEKEVKREKGEKKRVREGNGNLDSFVNTKRKAVVQGEE